MRRLEICMLLVALSSAGRASALEHLLVVEEVIHDGNAPASRPDDFADTTFLVAWSQAHAALTFGSFAPGMELGGFVRDARRSTYGGAWRRRQEGAVEDTALELATEQVFGRSIGGAAVRLVWPDQPETDNLLFVPSVGYDLYYRDYCFVSCRATRDPRPGTGTTLRVAHRVGRRDAYFEVALAPRTDGVVNYSIAARWKHLLVGLARDRDFDFSRLDRRVLSVGFHHDLVR